MVAEAVADAADAAVDAAAAAAALDGVAAASRGVRAGFAKRDRLSRLIKTNCRAGFDIVDPAYTLYSCGGISGFAGPRCSH